MYVWEIPLWNRGSQLPFLKWFCCYLRIRLPATLGAILCANTNNYSKNPFKSYVNKFKGKGKGKHTVTIKKGGEKHSCSHYKKGPDVSQWWNLHLELRPKRYGGYKEKVKAKNVVVVLQDVGFDSSDEIKVSIVEVQGLSER